MSMTLMEDIRALQEIIVRELPRWIEERPELRQRLAEALGEALILSEGREPAPPRMTYEEFLEWADEDTLAEWVDGEVVMYTPASDRHQNLTRFLMSVLGIYVETRGLGVVRPAPFQMKLERGREPDLLFVAHEHLGRLKETHLEGPADLVVEIVSTDSIARDRGEKFYEYEAGGVQEYWLLDPDRRWAEFYRLGEDGRYRTAFTGAEGVYHSDVVLGFWLRVEWLWQEPLPHPLRALGEIAGLDPEAVERFLQALGGEG
jgi:Uma2 family endonuclease